MWILYLTLRDQVEDLWTSFSWIYGPLLFLIIIIIYLFVCLFLRKLAPILLEEYEQELILLDRN